MFTMDAQGVIEGLEMRRWAARARALPDSLTDADRRRYNAALVLPNPHFHEIQTTLEMIMLHNSVSPTRRMFLGVTGDYTVGKSDVLIQLAMNLVQDEGAQVDEALDDGVNIVTKQPVMWTNACATGEAALAEALGVSAGLPFQAKTGLTAAQMLRKTAQQCVRSEIRLGILDDVNMLASSQRKDQLRQFCKSVSNELPITLVFCGQGLLTSSIFSDPRAAAPGEPPSEQIRRRLVVIEIKNIPTTNAGIAAFAKLVRACYPRFMLRASNPAEDLGPSEMALLHQASRGRPGSLFRIMCWAGGLAVGNEERFSLDLLKRAIETLPKDER